MHPPQQVWEACVQPASYVCVCVCACVYNVSVFSSQLDRASTEGNPL